MHHLILGGARSGKSGYAEALLADSPEVLYVATARPWPGDTDFAARIAEHQRRRDPRWQTDDSSDLIDLLHTPPAPVLLVDDLGTWLTHELDSAAAWDQPRGSIRPRCTALIDAVSALDSSTTLVIVSPEVGMGIIPEHRAGRLFRDELGWLNAQLAEVLDSVTLVIAGQPLQIKT
ncbi:Bifunctional adenosylcobalamin biosynthesis protein CobU [Corynebacterium ciconiae DSM 44920]|uniref:bifunctional adenosylcobinamide kinase/adenosylcobinamide-phosphate guanylyltransferase n=1 Tax=Corynebacterium ciconiae TaxID=227319 RepID=UPI00037A589C|nr:bifunctional adenosylcobinamide kinase/adenosylcobinamide-phosphate guanylyltransferase [Corynebacterium ciconiae]WKD60750.1 Bifunctional adenosylcobalamin biosynthesis protein CobU [Corynebacterium ciconiae DSM 44920]